MSEIYKDFYYKSINHIDGQSNKTSLVVNEDKSSFGKSGEVCWICEGYKEIKFTFKLN